MTLHRATNLAEQAEILMPKARGPMLAIPACPAVKSAGPSKKPDPGCAETSRKRPGNTLLSLFEKNAFQQHFQPNSTILLHGEPADAVYLIESGTVRCCTIDTEGRRQIFAFVRKNEFVGISDVDCWHFTAEAVDHVILRSIPRATVEHALAVDVALGQEIRNRVRILLERRERQLLSLVWTKAAERLLAFLDEFAATRSNADYVVLPMPRRDIADHLGLSVETVSRAFSELKAKGLIELATHEKYRIPAAKTVTAAA